MSFQHPIIEAFVVALGAFVFAAFFKIGIAVYLVQESQQSSNFSPGLLTDNGMAQSLQTCSSRRAMHAVSLDMVLVVAFG